jgi:lipopolysaccharide transport system permease protein
MLGLYVFIFGYIFGGSFGMHAHESHAEYGLGIFLGLAFYNFISDLLTSSPMTIITRPNYVKKVVFPLEILPAATVLAACVNLAITTALVLLGVVFFADGVPITILWLPVVVAPVVMLGLGLAWMLSALGVFLRDLNQILPTIGVGLMFASAIFYSPSRIPDHAWQILKFNPLIHAITLSRAVALWGTPMSAWGLGYLYVTGILSMFAGFVVFSKLKPAFADVM